MGSCGYDVNGYYNNNNFNGKYELKAKEFTSAVLLDVNRWINLSLVE